MTGVVDKEIQFKPPLQIPLLYKTRNALYQLVATESPVTIYNDLRRKPESKNLLPDLSLHN